MVYLDLSVLRWDVGLMRIDEILLSLGRTRRGYFGFSPRDEELPRDPPSAPAPRIAPGDADGAGPGVNTGRDIDGAAGGGAGEGARFIVGGGAIAPPEFLMPPGSLLRSRPRLRIAESSSRVMVLPGGGVVVFGAITGVTGVPVAFA